MKAVVIFSGGMDSATLLWTLASEGHDVYPLSFNYGQRHAVELQYASEFAQHMRAEEAVNRMRSAGTERRIVDHRVVDLRSAGKLLGGSALTSSNIDVPDGHYSADSMRITVVPNRNAIMLSLAWGYAVSIGADLVATAVHAGDHAVYPDCRPNFIRALNVALKTATEGFASEKLALYAPFVEMSKTDIVRIGTTFRVPYDLTWSCYKGGDVHCGTCGTCTERKEAFADAGVIDPTVYQSA